MSRRPRVFVGLFVIALALIPVAVAWACNPQAHISLDRTSYAPGQSITVYGSYFATNADITVSGPVNSVTVKSSSGGAFTATLTAPSGEGSYSVTATRPTGGYAPASFSVAAPAQPAQPSQPAEQPSGSSQAPAQSQDPAPSRSFSTPGVTTSKPAASKPQRQTSSGGRRDTTSSPSTPSAPAQVAPAAASQPVFTQAGSTATGQTFAAPATRAGRRGGADQRSSAGVQAATPSEQAALSDVWSTFQPGRTPTLTSQAGTPSGATDSTLAWGIGILGIGLFALVGGLAYTEARRRRVA
jgi:hypothetical protein